MRLYNRRHIFLSKISNFLKTGALVNENPNTNSFVTKIMRELQF